MLIVMQAGATPDQVRAVEERVRSLGLRPQGLTRPDGVAIAVTGNRGPIDPGALAGLASREAHPADTVVEVAGRPIGGPRLSIIAGPCAVESESQTLTIAEAVARGGADCLRGGAFKPLTSPYSFQGLSFRRSSRSSSARWGRSMSCRSAAPSEPVTKPRC